MQRQTNQRDAIRRVFEASARPLSPQEILREARREVPGLGIATVYRAVKTLTTSGFLSPVELPGAPARYERAGKQHHHHFHCRSCDRVYDVDACPGAIGKLSPEGFELESHEIVLYGRCDRCAG
ncbi:Fur family transcriptional regulator [Acidobacteria bacterium Mor1]|nr:Fur family transcriptional regulator [Acidobacteria bacterium Mor1]